MQLLTQHNLQDYCDLYADEQIMQHLGGPIKKTDAKKYFRQVVKNNQSPKLTGLTWAIINKQEQFCGITAIQWFDEQIDVPEAGIMVKSEFWNIGCAREVFDAMVNWAFKTLSIEQVIAYIAPDNTAALHFLRSIAFQINAAPDIIRGSAAYKATKTSL